MVLTKEIIEYRNNLTFDDLTMVFYVGTFDPSLATIENVISSEVFRVPVDTIQRSFSQPNNSETITVTATASVDPPIEDVNRVGVMRGVRGTSSPAYNATFTTSTSAFLGVNPLQDGDRIVYNGVSTTVVTSGNTIVVSDAIFPTSGTGTVYDASGLLVATDEIAEFAIESVAQAVIYTVTTLGG